MIIFWVIFFTAFFGTLYVMPHSIRKLRENNYVVKDMYKYDKPIIPTNSGIIVIFVSLIAISFLPLLIRLLSSIGTEDYSKYDLSETSLAFLLVVSIYALYGLVDDLVDIGRKLKFLIPIVFSFPLISVVRIESIFIPLIGMLELSEVAFFDFSWEDIFRITIIPIYVMVVSNLVNMHSGYNGLQSGLSLILISAILFKSWIDNILSDVIPVAAFLGAILAHLYYNFYPSKVFEGNIGSLLFGSIIGSLIVVQKYWYFGFFILIPHTFNFLLWIIWLSLMRSRPDLYLEKDGIHKKFGSVNEKGILIVPNRLTLKWIPNYYFDLNEKQSVIICYGITFFFCVLGLILIN